ncbi:hypothetical protein Avbf_16924, partial [Armadillidium vulgare]
LSFLIQWKFAEIKIGITTVARNTRKPKGHDLIEYEGSLLLSDLRKFSILFSDLLEGKMTKVTMIALLIIAILTIFINLGVIIRVIKLLRKGGELKPTFLFIAFVVTACEETICTISLIAIDKYIFICHGISYRGIVTKKRVRISILITWIYSLLIGFLPAMGLHEDDWCACNFTLYISTAFSIVLFLAAVVIPLTGN